MNKQFIADVGGTNIRLALVENGKVATIKKYLCADFPSIHKAIDTFFTDINVKAFDTACIGIACPVNDDVVKMTNHSWTFSKTELKAYLGLKSLYVINDFTAIAHSLPVLTKEQVIQVGNGSAVTHANIAVFGAGTGLGVEHLKWTSDGWTTLDGEGGHVDFAPVDETDIIVWRYLTERDGRASAEEVISGRGIVNIYNALADHQQLTKKYTSPIEISDNAMTGRCALCVQSLQVFCRAMGSLAGNLALNSCAMGGVFIGGGIVAKLGEFFINSDFRRRFESKGKFSHYVLNIPTFIINEPDHGLLGALAYLNQQIERA